MKLMFVEDAWDDYLFWQTHSKEMLRKTNKLIKETMRMPCQGLGKPEALRFDMAGYWSRRIDSEHRLVYKVEDNLLIILQCRYHY